MWRLLNEYTSNLVKALSALKSPIITFFTTLSIFFAPIAGMVFSAIILAIADLLIRLVAINKKDGFDSIKSTKMYDTITKILSYAFFIIILHLLDEFFLKDFNVSILKYFFAPETVELLSKVKLAAAASFVIIIRELKSIDENWEYAFGWSFLKSLQSFTGNLLKFKQNAKSGN